MRGLGGVSAGERSLCSAAVCRLGGHTVENRFKIGQNTIFLTFFCKVLSTQISQDMILLPKNDISFGVQEQRRRVLRVKVRVWENPLITALANSRDGGRPAFV